MEVVNKYRDHFTYVVSEPDRGQSNALNKGFAQATGEIFAWLNSDDRLAPSALYVMALAFYTSKADVVAGVCQIFKDGVEIEQHLTSCPNGKIALDDILDLENCWLQGKFFYQPEVMFTRAIWEKAGGKLDESLYYSMDYEMWARFALQGAKLQVIGHPIAQYRLHAQQKTSTMDKYQPELLNVRASLRHQLNLPLSNGRESVTRKRRSLKIAVLNDTGSLGGAGIANQRIAQALALAGHQVVAVAGTLDWSLTPVNCTPEEVAQTIHNLNPDLLIIGNIHNFQYPVEILETLTAQYPTVFVMHDQWLFTGRCGYTGGCENYTVLCDGKCPNWEQYPRLAPKKIAPAFARKQALLDNRDKLLILGDSQWLTNWARYAYLNHAVRENYPQLEQKFQHIYYGLDVKIFRPQDKIISRRQLGLPEDKFIILTGSQSLEDERKGFKYLLKALEMINLTDVLVLCFGHDFNLQTHLAIESIGYINNPALLATYYSAVDLFVSPALEEAFGQTFIEAGACGTPAVGFSVGGVKEAIKDRVSGRLVKQKTPQALAKIILELYRDRDQLELLSRLAPLHIANNFAFTSSYHSIITALETSGWLSNLGMSAVSKFTTKNVPEIEYLTIKDNPTQTKLDMVNFKETNSVNKIILMDNSLQGSGWFPPETVNNYPCRWMKKLGTIIIKPINSLEPLQLQLSVLTAVDLRLLYKMKIKINGYSLKVSINHCDDNSWICEGEISPELLTPEVPFLVSIEVPEVRHLAPNDPRKCSLLVRWVAIKSQHNDFSDEIKHNIFHPFNK